MWLIQTGSPRSVEIAVGAGVGSVSSCSSQNAISSPPPVS